MSVICSKFSPWGQRSFLNSTMRVLEHNMLIHPTSKIGACILLCHPTLLSFSFLVIDRNSSISQVDASNVTDSCYRMTRKLNESNVGWQSSTQAPILEVGWINILCSRLLHCLYGPRKILIQASLKSELANSIILWHFLTAIIWHT